MAATLIGVVYDVASGEPLRVVVPADDGQLALHVGPGEGCVMVPLAQYSTSTPADVWRLVAAAMRQVGGVAP